MWEFRVPRPFASNTLTWTGTDVRVVEGARLESEACEQQVTCPPAPEVLVPSASIATDTRPIPMNR